MILISLNLRLIVNYDPGSKCGSWLKRILSFSRATECSTLDFAHTILTNRTPKLDDVIFQLAQKSESGMSKIYEGRFNSPHQYKVGETGRRLQKILGK